MSRAFVFPGQGSQSVGMMASLAEAYPVVRETFDAASGVLNFDLWALAQQGPAEQLALTEVTQPLMLVAGVATWRAWGAAGGAAPDWVAGHSLGEFTALVAAGTLGFEDAVDLVRVRGELMRDAVPAGQGGMAAVLGLEDAAMEAVCATAAQGEVVEAVNFNAPGQVVIAGHRTAIARAIEGAKAVGAKRALPLAISVPCHSSLMRPAAERLRERLAKSPARRAALPVPQFGGREGIPRSGGDPRSALPAARKPGALGGDRAGAGRARCHALRRVRSRQGACGSTPPHRQDAGCRGDGA